MCGIRNQGTNYGSSATSKVLWPSERVKPMWEREAEAMFAYMAGRRDDTIVWVSPDLGYAGPTPAKAYPALNELLASAFKSAKPVAQAAFLLPRPADNSCVIMTSRKGQIHAIGGKFEQGETPVQAVAREVYEEFVDIEDYSAFKIRAVVLAEYQDKVYVEYYFELVPDTWSFMEMAEVGAIPRAATEQGCELHHRSYISEVEDAKLTQPATMLGFLLGARGHKINQIKPAELNRVSIPLFTALDLAVTCSEIVAVLPSPYKEGIKNGSIPFYHYREANL